MVGGATAASGPALGVAILAAAVVGLMIGSFLNVVVYRVPRGLSVNAPRSFCPRCGTPVAASDNVPVLSWLVLRGRCRHCGEPISVRYPLVEAGTAVSFALVAAAVGPHWAVLGLCLLAATLIAQAVIELDGLAVPAPVAFVGTGLGAAALLVTGVATGAGGRLLGAGVGVAAGGLASMVATAAGRDRSGADRWVGGLPALLALGAWVGWLGAIPAGAGAAVGVALVSGVWRTGRPRAGIATAAAAAAAAALAVAAAGGWAG